MALIGALCLPLMHGAAPPGDVPANGRWIQQAIDREPGRMVFVPAGDYLVREAIKIRRNHSGLWGPGRIVSSNPAAAIIEVEGASDVQVRDLALTRAAGTQDTDEAAVSVARSQSVVLSNLRIVDNWTGSSAIAIKGSADVQVRNCFIRNYCRIAIDDRRRTPKHIDYENYGYAFTCIAGNGLMVGSSKAVAIVDNVIIEDRLLPTPEVKAKYRLGNFVAKDPLKGRITPQKAWDEEYVNNWNQSRGMGFPGDDFLQITGNYVENAGQGMDIHSDHVVLAANIVNNSHIGMKAMHGARNVMVIANQFSKSDLWSINLMPGTSSHPAEAARGSLPARDANIDGHSIVANNIISDFGRGNAYWIWGDSVDLAPIRFEASPLPENPRLQDVVVEGNVVYDTGRDGVLVSGKPQVEPPRYAYGVRIGTGPGAPIGLLFANNLINPGTKGTFVPQLTPVPASPPAGAAPPAESR